MQLFQRSRHTRGGTVRRHTIACKSRSPTILTVCCSSQRVFAAAKLILLVTTKPLRRRPDRTLLLLLQMSGDVHPNPGPATEYQSRRSYQCNRCSGWVHAKCSGLLNSVQYRRSSDWVCDPCSTPPPPSSPSPTPTLPTVNCCILCSTGSRIGFSHWYTVEYTLCMPFVLAPDWPVMYVVCMPLVWYCKCDLPS